MKFFRFATWLVLAILPGQALAQQPSRAKRATAPPTRVTQPRFSREVLELFTAIGRSYELNGKVVSPTEKDVVRLVHLAKSEDPQIRELAIMACCVIYLQVCQQEQGQKTQQAIRDQAMIGGPKAFARLVTSAIRRGGEEPNSNELRDVGNALEDLIGTKPQQEVNNGLKIALAGMRLLVAMKERMRALAGQRSADDALPERALTVRITVGSQCDACLVLTNRSGRTLHHCLMFTRMVPDRELVLKGAVQQELVGALLSSFMGLKPETVEGSLKAGRLQTLISLQDQGAMIYAPEIPPGAKVQTLLCPASYLRVAKQAEASLWCDEGTVDGQKAENLNYVRGPAMTYIARARAFYAAGNDTEVVRTLQSAAKVVGTGKEGVIMLADVTFLLGVFYGRRHLTAKSLEQGLLANQLWDRAGISSAEKAARKSELRDYFPVQVKP